MGKNLSSRSSFMNGQLSDTRNAGADLTRSIEAFGAEVRQLRKARGMTLNQVSRVSGVSLSHLSAIERGSVNASITKIQKIADALSVPVSWFFSVRPGEGLLEQNHVVRAENRRNLNMLYGKATDMTGCTDWLLSSTIGGGFHLGLSDFAPSSGTVEDGLLAREGEQHALVIDGELELRLEDEIITLRAGDSYSIPGGIPRSTRNKSDRPARLIWVNSPVIVPKDAVMKGGSRRSEE